jgi:sterol desaturase/sphingolipid hydroxylase (fatty acid hydroxylase superfamily)
MLIIYLPFITYLVTSKYYGILDYKSNHLIKKYSNQILYNWSIQILFLEIIYNDYFNFETIYNNYYNYNDIYKLPFLLIVNDLLFGSLHLFMHKYLWNYHKMHHELTIEKLNGYNAQYSSITDHILTSLLPVFLTAQICNLSYLSTVIWFCLCEYGSVSSHLSNELNYHSLHHKYNNINYGTSIGLFDTLYYIYKKVIS